MEFKDLRNPLVRLEIANANAVVEVDPFVAERLAGRKLAPSLAGFGQRKPIFRGWRAVHGRFVSLRLSP